MTTAAAAPTERKMKLGRVVRNFELNRASIDVEARTCELSFSSELPYERWWGTEILDHAPSSVRLGRLNGGGPLLVNHDTRDQVGVVERAEIGSDRKGRAVVRFGKSQRAQEIFQDVQDGIRRLVSVAYEIHRMVLEEVDQEEDDAIYRAVDWEPLEISIVPIPADPTVGVGRAAADKSETETIVIVPNKEQRNMPTTTEKPPVVETDTRAAVTQERERIREINALAAKFTGRVADAQARAAKAADDGTPLATFREQLWAAAEDSGALRVAEKPEIGLSQKDLSRYSFLRMLRHVQNPTDKEAEREAAFEIECSHETKRKMGDLKKDREGGCTVPVDVLNAPLSTTGASRAVAESLLQRMGVGGLQRDLTVGTNSAGGYTVATDLLGMSFIELLRNAMVVNTLGTTILRDLNGNVAIPRQTGSATGYWVAENSAVTESAQTVDQVTLSPKTVGAFTDYSRRLLLQSSIDVEAFVRMDIALVMALAIDLAAINGSGSSNQPTGVLNTSGIGSVAGGTNGAAPDWTSIVNLESAVANANAAIGSLGYLTNTKVRGKLKQTQQFSSTNGRDVWSAIDYNKAVSNQVPSNLDKGTSTGVCSAIIFGNWRDLLIGMWGGMDMMLDPYTGATAGTKRLIALQDLDIAVRHATSFAAMKDALTT